MASQYIYVNRKKYAVGLLWQPVRAGVVVRNYARTLARAIDKKLNLFTEYRSMVGLASRRLGARVGMSVAAAAVMERFAEYTSFLAVFRVNSGFYLVAARNGIILADKVFETEKDARAEYVKLSEIPDWGAFFAPGAWGMPKAAERDIGELLNGYNKTTMHSISHFGVNMFSVALFVVFVLGMLVLFREPIVQVLMPRPKLNQVNPELVAEYKKQLEEKNKQLDVQFEIEKPQPPEPIVMPYELLPDAAARADLCYRAIAFVMQPVIGWNQTYAECGEEYVTTEFVRNFGTLNEFYTIVADLMPGAFVQEVNEDVVRVQARLPQLNIVSSVDERDVDSVVRDVTTLFQEIDMDLQTQIVTDTLTNGVDVANVNLVEVGVKSKLIPMQFMKIFEDFGGTYMIRARWDVRSLTWNYEVIIYAK